MFSKILSYRLFWTLLGVVSVAADYFSGPVIQFPILFLIPIAGAAWYVSRRFAVGFAVLMPGCRLLFYVLWATPWSFPEELVNALIIMAVLVCAAGLIARTARQTKELAREVQVLTGLLPICAGCKKIRAENDRWQPVEQYISSHAPVEFSHGLCPECEERLYPDL